MKRYIYITLLVFASLFCQAFGAQNGWPTFYDTVCADPDAPNIHISDFKLPILRSLYDREDSIWSECCNTVKVELGDITGYIIEKDSLFNDLSGEKINTTKTIQLDVEYTRTLVCSKLPLEKDSNMPSATLAMWHIFGKLLSETETGKVTKISDEASITTLHQVTFFYRFELAFPDDILFKINGDTCLNEDDKVELSVDSAYLPYTLKWQAEGMDPVEASGSSVKFESKSDDNYLYSVSCTATACKGETRSATFVIGAPTPTPRIKDLACIAANDTSFEVNVNNPNPQLFYHWTLEDLGNGTIVDTQQGASVTMKIPQNELVKLKLVSTGGCKASDVVTQVLHRSVVAGNIQLQGDTNCIFIGDTLRLSLSETPEDTLIWQIAGNTTMLPPHDTYAYPTVQDKDNVVVSVYAKACPNNIITNAFNIREDFRVSLGTSPMCISANEYQAIKLTSNGINPEVHWYGNGVEIDSTTYSAKDSILLRLTNPGDPNLYVKVIAKECGRERDTLVVLRPKPKMPSLDPLWGVLTPCIPLGMADTIELRVQPQEGVKFKWDFSDNAKFQRIAESDNHSISVATNFGLLDSEEDKTIDINIAAYTEGCSDTLVKTDTLYATGAGLGAEWDLLQQNNMDYWLSIVGFSDNDTLVDGGFANPFNEIYSFDWHSDYVYIENPSEHNYIMVIGDDLPFPFNLSCKLTNVEMQCYSVYSIEVIELELQDVLFTAKKGEDAGNDKGTEALQAQVSLEKEDMPCPGIVLKPNPVHSGTQVKVEGICETESFTVECYSPQGRLMFRTTAKGDTFILPTDNYAAGVYIVKIQWNGAAAPIIKKLIIL